MLLPPKGKILALDIGTRRTGVAVSDFKQKIAFPRDEIIHQTDEELVSRLLPLVAEEKMAGILVGLPIGMDGEETKQTEKVHRTIKALSTLKLPLETTDERLTSKQAKDIQSKIVDSRAAHIMLETYLRLS